MFVDVDIHPRMSTDVAPLEGVFFAAYANREGRARLHVLFVSS